MPRTDWHPRSPLSAVALATDQAWRHQLLRRHNRFLHGHGVICGLHVVPAAEAGRPWAVRICPGYGLGPHGDEVTLCCSVVIDIAEWLWAREPSNSPRAIVAVQPADTSGRMGPQYCGLCSHAAAGLKPARTREITIAKIVWERPAQQQETVPPVDICRDQPECFPCPDDASLSLAYVKLPPGTAVPISEADITAV